jgi:hypothetical protein
MVPAVLVAITAVLATELFVPTAGIFLSWVHSDGIGNPDIGRPDGSE